MNKPNYKTTGLLIGATALMASSALALADLGNGSLQLETVAGLQYDSNIYTNDQEVGDYIATLSPTLLYVQDGGVINLELGVGLELGEFLDEGEESYQNLVTSFEISGLDREGSNLGFEIAGGWRESSAASEEVGARIESDLASLSASVDFTFSEKTGIRVSGSFLDSNYRKDSYADSEDLQARIDALYLYSEKLTLKAGYRYRDISYPSPYVSQESDTFIVGAEGELSAKLTGIIELGYSLQDSAFDDFFFYSAALEWALDEKTTLILQGTRDNSSSPTGDNVINTGLTLTAQQSFTEKVSGSAFIGLGQYEKAGTSPRTDDIFRTGLGLSNAISETSSIDFNLSYEKRDSESVQSDYDRILASAQFNLLF